MSRRVEDVRVKPLEWVSLGGGHHRASSAVGLYFIKPSNAYRGQFFVAFGSEILTGAPAPSEDEAFTIAQKDFEARIRSSLSQEEGETQVGTIAEHLILTVKELLKAEFKHARLGAGQLSPINTSRDDADHWHAALTNFTLADCDAALRLIRRRQSAELLSLRRKVEETEAERDEARTLVTEANNSLYGSQGYFHSLNGGPFDKYHLATGIENLKSSCRAAERKVEEQRRALETALVAMKLGAALPGVSDEYDFAPAIETAARALAGDKP